MIRIVVTGTECTGKTTLAGALAEHYGTVWVPEYVRQFVLEKGAPPESEDVEAIALGQMALEDQALAAVAAEAAAGPAVHALAEVIDESVSPGPCLVLQDTDLLSTVVYGRHYYGDLAPWIEDELLERPADLYLLAGIDMPWVAEGDQRDRGDRREEMHALFRDALLERGLRFIEITGPHEQRMATAVAAIDALIAG